MDNILDTVISEYFECQKCDFKDTTSATVREPRREARCPKCSTHDVYIRIPA